MAFQEKIKDFDATSSKLSFEEEANIIEAYENRF
jgi:hypothetical protein